MFNSLNDCGIGRAKPDEQNSSRNETNRGKAADNEFLMDKHNNGTDNATSNVNTGSIDERGTESTEKLRVSLVRKFDYRLVPAMFPAHLLFFLDKSNIALPRINGLERDLRLSGNQFNIALEMFFVLNIVFNIPGNLAVRSVGGAIWLPSLITAWGLVITFSVFITNFAGLCVTRAFWA
ncbi:major facilitator superfamily transporter [Colletotrichum incanum]|uniref:Major facilitator superfamily transporter n=1 Tax=Colletotrichum incanum TaxID=1573173 RepID=A0A167DXV7_COLIC|nr:major facilitator superfamily transporter [Colletotrichum incanum]